jgi:hypothetical protein
VLEQSQFAAGGMAREADEARSAEKGDNAGDGTASVKAEGEEVPEAPLPAPVQLLLGIDALGRCFVIDLFLVRRSGRAPVFSFLASCFRHYLVPCNIRFCVQFPPRGFSYCLLCFRPIVVFLFVLARL